MSATTGSSAARHGLDHATATAGSGTDAATTLSPRTRRRRDHDTALWRQVPLAVWFIVLGIGFSMFAGHSDKMGLPIGLDRVLVPAGLILMLFDRRETWWRLRSVHVAMVALAVWATMSYLAHPENISLTSFFTLLDRLYMPFLLFAAAPYFLGTPARRGLFLRVMTVAGGYISFITLAEVLGLSFLLFPRYIARRQAENDVLAAMTGDVERAGGPFLFGEPNGMVLAMCAFATVLLASRTKGPWRVAALVVAPLCFVTLIATLGRGVWLGAALGVVLVACTRWRWIKWLPALALAEVAVLVVGSLLLPDLAGDVAVRVTTSRSLWDRVTTNNAAVAMMLDRPLTGVGWQQFTSQVHAYAQQADLVPLGSTGFEVHNVFLSRGAELGVPGFFGFILVVLLGPLTALVRPVRRDLVGWQLLLLAVAAVWFTVSMTSPNPYVMPAFIMWSVAGFVLAAPGPDSEVPPAEHA